MNEFNLENSQTFRSIGSTPNTKVTYVAADGAEAALDIAFSPDMTAADLYEAISKKSEDIASREIRISFTKATGEEIIIKVERQERATGDIGDLFLGKDLRLTTVNGQDGKWYACKSNTFAGIACASKDEALRLEESFTPEFRAHDFTPQELAALKIVRNTVDQQAVYSLFMGAKRVASSSGCYAQREFMLQDFIIKQYETRRLPQDSTYLNAKAFFLQEYVADYTKSISDPASRELLQLFKTAADPTLYNNAAVRLLRVATVGDLLVYDIAKPEDINLTKMQKAFAQIYQDVKAMCGMGVHPSSVVDICKKLADILQQKYGIPLMQVQQLFAESIKAGFDTPVGKIGFGVGDYDKFQLEGNLRQSGLLPELGQTKADFDTGAFLKDLGVMALNAVKKTLPLTAFGTGIVGAVILTAVVKDTPVDQFMYQDIQMLQYFNSAADSAVTYSIPGQKGDKPTAYEQDAYASLSLSEFGSIDSTQLINQLLFREYADFAVQTKVSKFLIQLDKWIAPDQRDVKTFFFCSADGKKIPVFLIGGQAQDGQFYYLDPSTGNSIKAASRDAVFNSYCQNNALPGHGQISFLNEDSSLIVYTTKADVLADGLATLNAAASVGAMVTMVIPGLGEVSLGLFAASLGTGIAAKLYSKEPWTTQEVVSTVIQGMMIGGSGGANILRAALKAADKVMLVKVLDIIGKTGFGLMLTETSITGLQGLYEKDPEKLITFLMNVGMIIAAGKAQKFGEFKKAENRYLRMGFKKAAGTSTDAFVKDCSAKLKKMTVDQIALLKILDAAYSPARVKVFERYMEFREIEGKFIQKTITAQEYTDTKYAFFRDYVQTVSPEARKILKCDESLLTELLDMTPQNSKPISAERLTRIAKALADKPDVLKVEVLHTILAAYHPDTAINHSMKMQEVVKIAGNALSLSSTQIIDLELACLVHDIGKLFAGKQQFLDNPINFRVAKLPQDIRAAFFDAQMQHPIDGQKILDLFGLQRFSDYALKHHLNVDGSGYPQKDAYGAKPVLNPQEIDVQILKVLDIYNALREPRVYKTAKEYAEIIEALQDMPSTVSSLGKEKSQEVTTALQPLIDQMIFILSLAE